MSSTDHGNEKGYAAEDFVRFLQIIISLLESADPSSTRVSPVGQIKSGFKNLLVSDQVSGVKTIGTFVSNINDLFNKISSAPNYLTSKMHFDAINATSIIASGFSKNHVFEKPNSPLFKLEAAIE